MPKITLRDPSAGFNSAAQQAANNDDLEEALNNKVLYRDNPAGEANAMQNDFDMNSNRLLNLPSATSNNEPLTYGQWIAGQTVSEFTGYLNETQVATANQTVFTLSNAYTVGIGALRVFVNGVYQSPSVYAETSSTQVTFSEGLDTGDNVSFIISSFSAAGTSDATTVTYTPSATGAISRNVQAKLTETKSIKDFGAVGDLSADDSSAIQLGLTWLIGGANRQLVFPADVAGYRMASTATANFNKVRGGQIVMHAPIRPDAGIGNAIEIIDGADMYLKLWVDGGGQTADYTQADPSGADQAFYIRGVRGAVLDVQGYNYKGRVVRATVEQGSEAKTSRLTFNTFKTGDFGTAQCGQAIYADASSAFGHIATANWFWDEYGPVFSDVADVSIGHLDAGWNDQTGMVLEGVLSFWAGTLSMGDESNTKTLLTITDSASRSSANINIDSMLLNDAATGLLIENIDVDGPGGSNSWTGVRVGYIASITNSSHGVYIDNSRQVYIDQLDSHRDAISIETTGTNTKDVVVGLNALNTTTQAVILGASSRNITISGAIQNANTSATASTSAVEVNSTSPNILFDGVQIETANAEFAYDLVASNDVTLRGGDMILSGVTVPMGANPPAVVSNVSGYRTDNTGTATILNTGTSIVVAHGLIGTPTDINVTGRDAETSAPWVTSVGATNFTINVGSSVTADRTLYWRASLLQNRV